MKFYLVFYAWVLQTFSLSTGLFIPKEIIMMIIALCKIKTKFIKTENGLVIIRNNNIKTFGENFESAIKKEFIKPEISFKLCNFLSNNGVAGVKKIMDYNDRRIIITKCKKIIYCHDNKYKIINLDLRIQNIFLSENLVVSIREFGLSFFRDKNHSFDSESIMFDDDPTVKNIKKIICYIGRKIFIDIDGCVYISRNMSVDIIGKYKKVKITNIVNVYYRYDDNGIGGSIERFIFLSSNGEIYASGVNKWCTLGLDTQNDVKITEPKKINLNDLLSVHIDKKYCLALTMYNDLYIWGHVESCESNLGISINFEKNNYLLECCPFPILICRIKFDLRWNFHTANFIRFEESKKIEKNNIL